MRTLCDFSFLGEANSLIGSDDEASPEVGLCFFSFCEEGESTISAAKMLVLPAKLLSVISPDYSINQNSCSL